MLDLIGNLNPQLLRELKGRLNWRNVSAVIAVSIVVQVLLLLWFYSYLPTPENYTASPYCGRIEGSEILRNCYHYETSIPFPFKSTITNWQLWWQHIAHTFNICIPFLLIIPGTYFLLSDLQNEERQGTLDFIRLSPRSASSILHGKIFGVPSLVYGAIASLLPFHLVASLKAGNSLGFFLSFYTLVAAGAYLMFSFSLLFGFFSKSILKRSAQAVGITILYIFLVAAIFVPGYLLWNSETSWKTLVTLPLLSSPGGEKSALFWFGLPISQNVLLAHGFTGLNLVILSGWIWQGLIRCFHQPNATILRKRQSYGLIFYLQALILGLHVQSYPFKGDPISEPIGLTLLPLLLNLPIFLALTAILSPQRQAVMDWARYRRVQSPRSSVLKDLLFHDQSPAGLAIGINLGISGVLWLIAFAMSGEWSQGEWQVKLMMTLLSFTLIALYAAIVQWVILQKTRKRNLIAAVMLVLLIVILPSVAFLLPMRGPIATMVKDSIILTSPFLWVLESRSWFSISFSLWSALLAQVSFIVGIHTLMARQVRQIGVSEMKIAQLAPPSHHS